MARPRRPYALGLRPAGRLRLVIIPQALRVIVPPLTSQYLNLTKNSSLAVVHRLSRIWSRCSPARR